jgi:uncharacterized lipoprotein YbaY
MTRDRAVDVSMKWMAGVAIVAVLAGCSSDAVRAARTVTVTQPSAAPEPSTPASDISFLDVGTGRLTPLPSIEG